jgi:hypothetical protein
MTLPAETLECPCCGDVGAESNADARITRTRMVSPSTALAARISPVPMNCKKFSTPRSTRSRPPRQCRSQK